jgi:NADPH-dependent 2,4-dienoyl-CoA reductase/sulfur reductase-like enzyme
VTANFGGAGLPSFAQAALEAYVKASNTGGGDSFGYSVALDGDTLAVGARLKTVPRPGSMVTRQITPQTAGRSMCLRARMGSGASRPM